MFVSCKSRLRVGVIANICFNTWLNMRYGLFNVDFTSGFRFKLEGV